MPRCSLTTAPYITNNILPLIINKTKLSYANVIKYVVDMSSCFMIITLSLCSSSPVVTAALRFYNSSTVISGRKDQPAVKKQITKTLNVTTNPEEKRKIIGDTFIKV